MADASASTKTIDNMEVLGQSSQDFAETKEEILTAINNSQVFCRPDYLLKENWLTVPRELDKQRYVCQWWSKPSYKRCFKY